MAHPLADPNDPTYRLEAEYEKKNEAAKAAWKAFEERRREAEKAGPDGINTKTVNEVRGLRDEYEAAAREAEKAKDGLMDHFKRLDRGKARTGLGTKEILPGSLPDNISKSIVESMGAKAFDVTAGGTAVGAFYDPRIRELPQRAMFVRSVIPVKSLEGADKFDYLRQTVATFNAAETAAGALKPTSVLSLERVEDRVRTIAHLSEPLDRALLLDLDGMAAFVDNQLRLGVLLREDAQIVSGNGVGENLRGILNTSGILTQARGADPHVDAVFKAITKLRAQANPFEPTAVVLHPNDLQTLLLAKDANGNYTASDSGAVQVDEEGNVSLFGKEVISSIAIAAGTGLVGDFSNGATIYDREQARVEWASSGALGAGGVEVFSRNQLVARGEERIGLAVERPSAFCSVTGL